MIQVSLISAPKPYGPVLAEGSKRESGETGAFQMGSETDKRRDDRAALIARNVAAAPPFSEATIEKLALILGPAAERARRASAAADRPIGGIKRRAT